MPVPLIGLAGLEDFGREGAVHQGANFGKGTRRSGGQHLHGNVAQRRRFRRPRQHSSAGGIGGELVQQAVLRTAADDADLMDRMGGQIFQIEDDLAIFESQALEHGPHVSAGCWRTGLRAFCAKSINGSA